MLSFQQQQNASPNGPPPHSQSQTITNSTEQPASAPGLQSMRLRDDPPPITPAPRNSRKRKSPSNNLDPPPPSASQQIQHVLPPPHALMHPIPGPLPGYSYPPADYTPGGLPPGQPPHPAPPSATQQVLSTTGSGRTLSQSKRAEQNRKAQRAFRERRDQCVMSIVWWISAELFYIDMSKLSNPAPNYWTLPLHLRTRLTGVGRNVVLWLTSSASRMRHCEQRLAKLRCFRRPVLSYLQPRLHQLRIQRLILQLSREKKKRQIGYQMISRTTLGQMRIQVARIDFS